MDGARAICTFTHHSELGWWRMTVGTPHPALRACALRYCSYAERTTGFSRRRELPWAGVALIIGFEQPLQIGYDDDPPDRTRPRRVFVGAVHDRPVTVDSAGAQSGVQVDLTPIGAHRLLGVPMDELANTVVELEDILGAPARTLAARLEGEPDAERRFALLDAVLARRLLAAADAAPAVAWAWERLLRTGGAVPVSVLAAETGRSRRYLTTAFTRHVGLPPRTLSRILRFERMMARLQASAEPHWAAIAADCGYYDQAHLNREVRSLAGATPTELAAARLPDGGGLVG